MRAWLNLIHLDYEELPSVIDIDEAIANSAPAFTPLHGVLSKDANRSLKTCENFSV
jgi:CO/xanthine dehydrogenase Mo-binding subunit